jgi:hypothetical protein
MKYDLLGKRFGKLVVIESVGVNSHNEHLWKCKCDCGNESIVNAYALVSGHTKSCGCLAADTSRKLFTKHGKYNSRLYRIYNNIKSRCYNEKHEHYFYYGGSDIAICDEWLGENGFINFYKWSIENGYDDSLTIDRIKNDGNYSPDNCRWVTIKEQQNNKRNNSRYTYNGQTKTLSEWASYFGVKYGSFCTKVYRKGFENAIHEYGG